LSTPMMANEIVAHILSVRFEGINWNKMQRQESWLVQMVELKDIYVVHLLL
jgi:hypothetical protein